MVKDIFLQKNGAQCNAFSYVSCKHSLRFIFNLLKDPDPSYLVLKFGDDFPQQKLRYGQECDLQNYDIKRPRLPVKVKNILTSNLHGTHECTCEISLRSY